MAIPMPPLGGIRAGGLWYVSSVNKCETFAELITRSYDELREARNFMRRATSAARRGELKNTANLLAHAAQHKALAIGPLLHALRDDPDPFWRPPGEVEMTVICLTGCFRSAEAIRLADRALERREHIDGDSNRSYAWALFMRVLWLARLSQDDTEVDYAAFKEDMSRLETYACGIRKGDPFSAAYLFHRIGLLWSMVGVDTRAGDLFLHAAKLARECGAQRAFRAIDGL